MERSEEIKQKQLSRLREALATAGINQKELAERVGYTQNGISQIFTGKNKSFKRETAEILGRELNVRPEWLLGEDNVKTEVVKPWFLKRFQTIEKSFHKAGYKLEQLSGGVFDPEVRLIPTDASFLITARKGSRSYRCTYGELVRLLDQIESTERALIDSFSRTSEVLSAEELQEIHEARREEARKEFKD